MVKRTEIENPAIGEKLNLLWFPFQPASSPNGAKLGGVRMTGY